MQAAEVLAEQLESYKNDHPLILGIPRGSVPMAKLLADRLNGEVDVVLAHKIGAPDNPEFAIGSVSEFGAPYRSHGLEFYEISSQRFREMADAELKNLKKRRETYSPIRPPISPNGRVVIIVDDGIATGSTMIAAVRAVRSQHPKKIIVASPVTSPGAARLIREEADQLITLGTPSDFFSISQYYEQFPQVTDEDICRILRDSGKRIADTKRVA